MATNAGRVDRLLRRVGLKVPVKQRKKGWLGLIDDSCVRLRSEHRDHDWLYGFVHSQTDNGKVFQALSIIDEYSREFLAISVDRKRNWGDVIDVLSDLLIFRDIPLCIRSNKGEEFVALAVRD